MNEELRLAIRGEMDVNRAVLEAGRYSRQAGFEETPSRMIATAVSELARNILRHGGGRGEVRLRAVEEGMRRGLEIEARDRGPGIANVERAMQDHYSSAGTLGLGLPGVRRMMDDFDLASEAGAGTRVTARKWL